MCCRLRLSTLGASLRRGRPRREWWVRPLVLWIAAGVIGCAASSPAVTEGLYFQVRGKLTRTSGEELSRASVALVGTPRGAVADGRGEFVLDRVREGTYRLTVLCLGYRSEPALLRVAGAGEQTFTLHMALDPGLGPALVDSLLAVRVICRTEPVR